MPERVLGLDVGSRTIGLAVTDELGFAAHALRTLTRLGTVRDVAAIQKVAQEYATDHLVVGLPLELDGRAGKRAERVRVLVEALRQAGLRVEEWDERFSTVEAQSTLLQNDVSRARRKQVIDQMAAQVILQRWLAAQSRSELGTP